MEILMLVLGLLGTIVGAATGLSQASMNKEAVSESNQTNLDIARETNQANVEQANLAYQRSLPTTQVNNLMAAGMSRAGALNKLVGGGSYTAPTLQGASVQPETMDLSGFAESMQRLQDIPSNVEQVGLVEDQREALRVDTENKIAANLREQEKHEYDMWTNLHGKRATEMLDNMSSRIVSKAAEKGVNLDSIDSIDKLVKTFDLNSDREWLSMPAAARNEILSGVRLQAAENRASQEQLNRNKEQENRNTAAKDAHTAALDALKNSEVERVLKHHQVNKLIADTEQSWQHVQEFDDATDARQKENALRAVRADYEKIMTNFGLSKSDIFNSNFYYMDNDGNIHLTEKARVKKGFEEAWKFAGSFFGVDLLKDIVSGIVAVSPK